MNIYKSQKGEIVTILAIGGAIIITIASLISSTLTNIKQTSNSKAASAFICTDKEGVERQTCNNENKCDIAGGCNPACCKVNSDCSNNQTCGTGIGAYNGYCKTNKSCDPNSGATPTPNPTVTPGQNATATPTPQATAAPTPTGSAFNGVCKDKDGVARQSCSNENKCDIVGGCNPACCKVNSDCPDNQTCGTGIGAYNGYCKTNSSCDPNSGKNQPTATPIPRATEAPTPVGQECGKWRSDECSGISCGVGKFCKNNHPASKCVCLVNPTAVPTTVQPSPTQPAGNNPTATGAPTAPPAGTVLYSCLIKVSGTVKGCIKGTPACGEVVIDPNDPQMQATMCIPKSDCTEANCLKIAKEKSDALAASKGHEITDFSNVRCATTVGASCGTVPITGGLGGVRVEGKCADPNDTTKPQDCPAVYNQKGTDGKDMVVNRSCAQPNQGNQFCNYVCFTPDGTSIVECWPGQNGWVPGVDLLSFNLYLINKSSKPLDIVNVSICKPRMNIFKPIPSADDFECTDNQSDGFTLATDQSKKINNNSGCSREYLGWRKIQVSYRDQNDQNTIKLSATFDATCSLDTVIGLP